MAFPQFGFPHSIIIPQEVAERLAFGHPLVLLETFVDPQRFLGTIYKADNWIYAGNTKGFRRIQHGYSVIANSPKMVFVKPLISNAQTLLSQPILEHNYRLCQKFYEKNCIHLKEKKREIIIWLDPELRKGFAQARQ